MKFNKPLFAFLFAVSLLNACGSAPEKPADGKPIEKTSEHITRK